MQEIWARVAATRSDGTEEAEVASHTGCAWCARTSAGDLASVQWSKIEADPSQLQAFTYAYPPPATTCVYTHVGNVFLFAFWHIAQAGVQLSILWSLSSCLGL